MTPSTFPATKLLSTQRIDLAIAAMAGSANISNVAVEYQVSRKFIYQQKDKATIALNEAFAATAPDDAVLFHLPVTKTWLNQLTLSLTLVCHSSYRGVVELMRDILGVSISEGMHGENSWIDAHFLGHQEPVFYSLALQTTAYAY